MKEADIKIQVSGAAFVGKSTIMDVIQKALTKEGFCVSAVHMDRGPSNFLQYRVDKLVDAGLTIHIQEVQEPRKRYQD